MMEHTALRELSHIPTFKGFASVLRTHSSFCIKCAQRGCRQLIGALWRGPLNYLTLLGATSAR